MVLECKNHTVAKSVIDLDFPFAEFFWVKSGPDALQRAR